ncbi:PTS sugar transporter subunit IIA [Corynebacterium antarcticum]|nr:PTS sugar transporter subunit IIA [Corynebacterium antarcticum]MCX7539547.1 PTS sugar transporter subunit IIA [Corynebacterium antarcticum]
MHRTGMSLIVLKEPVVFGHPDNDPVSPAVALTATDPGTHLSAMKGLTRTLRSAGARDEITRADWAEDGHRIFSGTRHGAGAAAPDQSPAPSATVHGEPDGGTVPSRGLILTVCDTGPGDLTPSRM